MTHRVVKQGLTNADLLRANIPEDYWRAKYGQIPDSAPYKLPVGRFLRDIDAELEGGHGIYLYHEKNGTGKTALACVIGKRALLRGFTVYYSMCESYKSAVVQNKMFDEYQSVHERARSVDLLLLDDFGKEYRGQAGWIEQELENLIRERSQAGRATILTSNLGPTQIKDIYSVDLSSVLKHSCFILPVPGADAGGKDWREETKLGLLRGA